MMLLTQTALVAASLIPYAWASCGYRTSHVPGFSLPAFNYDNVNGPLNWHNLNPAYYLCGNGTHQAPTIISSNSTPSILSSALHVSIPRQKNLEFENLGTTVEVPMNGTFTVNNDTYNLKQFHFHTPSEHRIDEEQYSMEMHFVFQTPANATAVLAFFIDLAPSATVPVLDTLANAVSAIPKAGDSTTISEIDFSSFLAYYFHPSKFWTLNESLTTPPCSEGVSWYISDKPILFGVNNYKKIKKVLKFNARYTQNNLGTDDILKVAAANLE